MEVIIETQEGLAGEGLLSDLCPEFTAKMPIRGPEHSGPIGYATNFRIVGDNELIATAELPEIFRHHVCCGYTKDLDTGELELKVLYIGLKDW